jgi:DNA-binding MarR family transcriptional regulator
LSVRKTTFREGKVSGNSAPRAAQERVPPDPVVRVISDVDLAVQQEEAVEPTLSRDEILGFYAHSGYSLEHHPAHLVRRVHQRATAIFQAIMSGDELTPTQFGALATVLKHEELSQNQLGRLAAMDPSTISIVVRALLNRGLIKRRSSEADQRMSMIALTDKGVRFTLERLDRGTEVSRRMLEPLSIVEQATLLDLLRRISADDDAPAAS